MNEKNTRNLLYFTNDYEHIGKKKKIEELQNNNKWFEFAHNSNQKEMDGRPSKEIKSMYPMCGMQKTNSHFPITPNTNGCMRDFKFREIIHPSVPNTKANNRSLSPMYGVLGAEKNKWNYMTSKTRRTCNHEPYLPWRHLNHWGRTNAGQITLGDFLRQDFELRLALEKIIPCQLALQTVQPNWSGCNFY